MKLEISENKIIIYIDEKNKENEKEKLFSAITLRDEIINYLKSFKEKLHVTDDNFKLNLLRIIRVAFDIPETKVL